MDGYLVEEARRDVEAILNVVEAALGLGQVLLRAEDGVVGAAVA